MVESALYLTMKWLHILGAGVVLGLLAMLPLTPIRSPRSPEDRAIAEHVLSFLHKATYWFMLPAIVVLFVTGLVMSVPPVAVLEPFSREGRWIVLGMALWTLIAGIVGGFMGGIAREMQTTAQRDSGSDRRLEDLWRQYRLGIVASIVVTLTAIWVMVFQPAF